jgi:PAS domain-containing protein
MADPLPPLLEMQELRRRLEQIFPVGTPYREYCTRLTAVRTIFVMLYIGAVEGSGQFIRPNQVTRMTTVQSKRTSAAARQSWTQHSLGKRVLEIRGRWYADNTREPIRDETIRMGLIQNNAVIEREELPTNSSKPRYALKQSFAELLDPNLNAVKLQHAIANWQRRNLSQSALARAALMRTMSVASGSQITVNFPNGEARNLPPGPSSAIAKSVVEDFATTFLTNPALIYLADGRRKVVARNEEIARAIGLSFPSDRLLPDLLLVDLGPRDPLLVYVEVVASDGPVNELRKSELLDATVRAGYSVDHIAFVTAYADRDDAAFKRTVSTLAWGTFAWFVSEPSQLLIMRDQTTVVPAKLADIL